MPGMESNPSLKVNAPFGNTNKIVSNKNSITLLLCLVVLALVNETMNYNNGNG
jgi:hypothetical protein